MKSTNHRLRLACCPNFLTEVKAVLGKSAALRGVQVDTFPLACRQNQRPGGKHASPAGQEPDIVIGGGCLRGWWDEDNSDQGRMVLAPRQCFHLVAPVCMVDELIGQGAYLLTPAWLAHWRVHLREWGFDQATAQMFFQESTSKLALLDTGIRPDSVELIQEFAEYLGLPWQREAVGLEILELRLDHLVADLSRKTKVLAPEDSFFSDQLMLVEIMNDLLAANGEAEALEIIQDLFGQLFAPGELRFEPSTQQSCALVPPDRDFAWTESDQGFLLPLRWQQLDLGCLVVDHLAFTQYRQRYLTLALSLAKVCALALVRAREREAQRQAEQAMGTLAGIVKSSQDAIVGMSLQGDIVSWNTGAQNLYGYDEAEMLGRPVSFLTPPELPDPIPRLLTQIRKDQIPASMETVWMTSDGGHLNVSLQVSPIRDDQGRVVGASGIARDITVERRRAADERRKLESQLQQAQKMESIGRLAGGVAHDFNNMIGIILGYAELSLSDVPMDEEGRFNLGQIQHTAERAKQLASQLLAFARKQNLQPIVLDLNRSISDFQKMVKRIIGEDVDIRLKLEPGLPPIEADPGMVDQVLLNLAVNARDAMPQGGTLTMETQAVTLDQQYAATRFEVEPGDYVMLAVSDTGHGMDKQTRHMVFEPFFTTKESGRGTGLGLSTVYGIVKQHGGHIWVYSEPGQGTLFRVYLPVAGRESGGHERPERLEREECHGETVLVVEDEDGLRELIHAALSRMGYKILSAAEPKEALVEVQRHQGPIHLLLTDVVLPEMNGKLLYERLLALRPDLRVVFMSGYAESFIRGRDMLLEGAEFIQKPFPISRLSRSLRSALASGRTAPAPPSSRP